MTAHMAYINTRKYYFADRVNDQLRALRLIGAEQRLSLADARRYYENAGKSAAAYVTRNEGKWTK